MLGLGLGLGLELGLIRVRVRVRDRVRVKVYGAFEKVDVHCKCLQGFTGIYIQNMGSPCDFYRWVSSTPFRVPFHVLVRFRNRGIISIIICK